MAAQTDANGIDIDSDTEIKKEEEKKDSSFLDIGTQDLEKSDLNVDFK